MPKSNLKLADDFASDYDNSILKNAWIGPKLIFDLVKNKLKPKAEILDLGIGTGESSKLFEQTEHIITGLDGSANMLKKCKKKRIGSKLILHDIEETPFPFRNVEFDAVVSNGVFHLIYPLNQVFAEIQRVLKPLGLVAFTYENTMDKYESKEIQPGIWQRKTISGVITFKYEENLVSEYLNINNFKLISKSSFKAYTNKEEQKEIYFNAILAQRQ